MGVDNGYDVYCVADPDFYETPTRLRADAGGGDFELARREPPAGWERSFKGDWVVFRPAGVELAAQGWKIHVSARVDNCAEILAATWRHCLARRVPFKFLRGPHIVRTHNLKYMPRGSSGKFVTIYPEPAALEATVRELDALLAGQPGPYILSDLRVGAGPVHVRYGAFVERYCLSPKGTLVPAIADPAGRLVPDPRAAAFTPPAWAALPEFLRPHLAARDAVALDPARYRVERALHFSNGGGIYVAVDGRSGERVILKEARPHAGLSADGADAVARLRREHEILTTLAGLEHVPAARELFSVGEHLFLAQDFLPGEPLNKDMVRRYPLHTPECDPAALADYTRWAVKACRLAERAIAGVRERGVVFGDVHPFNLLLDGDERISLIDFEVATHARENMRPMLGNPAFAAPRDRTGFAIDAYALACLRLYVFLPLTTLFHRAPAKAAELADQISEIFPVDREFLDQAVRVITGAAAELPPWPDDVSAEPSARPRPAAQTAAQAAASADWSDPAAAWAAGGWPEARASIARAILASATPERDDRLYPGDIEQFATGGLNLAHGAAGVLYALAVTGAGRHPEGERWLARRAALPDPGARLGLYEGLHGVAFALDRLGHAEQARTLLEHCLAADWRRLGDDLSGGLAGVGLNLLDFAARTEDAALRTAALNVADVLADRVRQRAADDPAGPADAPAISGGAHPHAGLMRGQSGVALFFLRLHELTRDQELLDLAETALLADIRRCVTLPDGTLHVNEGWRTMPYLATGSAGVGLVAAEFVKVRPNERIAAAAAGARQAAQAQFYVQSGLFNGRAGMIVCLSRRHPAGRAASDPSVAAQVRRLGWHVLRHHGEIAFPGDQLLRLSMDLATGAAGVLLGLGAALHDQPVTLPGLDPLSLPALPVGASA